MFHAVSTNTRTADTTPSPGNLTVPQDKAHNSANPTAGASQLHRRPPQRQIAACPSASAETQTAVTAA
jgi:hypothetical protein